jgi:hypothetical protein
MAKRAKAKFRIGQVVRNTYYKDDYRQIKHIAWGKAKNDNECWSYSLDRGMTGFISDVWFEETALRKLTAREARQ